MKLSRTRISYAATAFAVVLTNYILDRATKLLALEFLRGKGEIPVIGNYFTLIYVENGGAFLSMGTTWNPYIKYAVLLIIPIVICLLLFYYILAKEKSLRKIVIMGSIIGGGLGNLVDRLCNGFKVIDFLHFGIGNIRTGVLNVADLSVTFGIIILILSELTARKQPEDAG